jgi:hypothetical protein
MLQAHRAFSGKNGLVRRNGTGRAAYDGHTMAYHLLASVVTRIARRCGNRVLKPGHRWYERPETLPAIRSNHPIGFLSGIVVSLIDGVPRVSELMELIGRLGFASFDIPTRCLSGKTVQYGYRH